ncbi:MAG: hypothetical protein RL537_659 [Actinomycetota bacterium]
MSNLGSLASKFDCTLVGDALVEPKSIAISSNFCEKDSIFVAVQGEKSHGLDFLSAAIAAGATALLTDKPGIYPLPTLLHPQPRQIAGFLAREIFQTPSTGLLGVTGTNGKTSTSFYLQRLLQAAGIPTGLISSAAQIVGSASTVSELTTPEAPRLHQLLSQMRQLGQMTAALEVSAQALVRNRVDGLQFDIAGFTNLSRDHLDDFGTMENYLEAKARLFSPELAKRAVINVEDEFGLKLYQEVEIPKVGIGPKLDYQVSFSDSHIAISGKAQARLDFGQGHLMAKNFALAAVMLLEHGVSASELEAAAKKIDQQIPGRLQRVSDKEPVVYVDYAHTPAGVSSAVQELLARHGRLVVVLGASGNRDQGKRREMALACAGVDKLIITDQHPRDENPALIRATLLEAARELDCKVFEEPNPAEAIAKAVAIADGAAVLWCGPGQLKYREVAGKKVEFDAIAIAKAEVENA